MAVVTAGADNAFDMDDLDPSEFLIGKTLVSDDDFIRVRFSTDPLGYDDFHGDFFYNGNGELVDGEINSISERFDGETQFTLSHLFVDVPTFLDFTDDEDGAGAKAYLFRGNDTVTGSDFNDTLLGYAGNDVIRGGRGDDDVFGGSGHDDLYGGKGDDDLTGGSGDDNLIGGRGVDFMEGGTGSDYFVFTSAKDSTAKLSGRDLILDFVRGEGDAIDLSDVDAKTGSGNQSFKFIGSDDFSGHKGELQAFRDNGHTYVFADRNGDGDADFGLELDNSIQLHKSDFLL